MRDRNIMSDLIKNIQKELKTQDNRITADPIFLVQEKERVYGMDLEYAPESCYYDWENYEEVSEEEYEKDLKEWGENFRSGARKSYEEVGYFDQWITKLFFFTHKAAQEYIDTRAYRHSGELRIYVASLCDNDEMRQLRNYILNYDS